MATIEMSPTFITGYTERMVALNQTSYYSYPVWATPKSGYTALNGAAWSGLLSNGGQADGNNGWFTQTTLNLMKGTKPTDFTSIPTWESRSTDIVTSFSPATMTVVYSENLATMSTAYVNAATSGTVTWFWLISRTFSLYDGLPADYPLVHQTMGTVGLPGTSSDLELQDVNLVAGQPYRVLNLGLRFPTSWTF
jgi:hypothetical protein